MRATRGDAATVSRAYSREVKTPREGDWQRCGQARRAPASADDENLLDVASRAHDSALREQRRLVDRPLPPARKQAVAVARPDSSGTCTVPADAHDRVDKRSHSPAGSAGSPPTGRLPDEIVPSASPCPD